MVKADAALIDMVIEGAVFLVHVGRGKARPAPG
jgi:hypothetical protein